VTAGALTARCATLATLATALLSMPVHACPLAAPTLAKDDVQVVWKVDGDPITVGRHFAVAIRVCPADAVLARVDAVMPEHRHGMNYRPSVKQVAPGEWRAEGLLFHMPGRWELRLAVRSAGRTENLADNIVLR
jgi:hypothetical protein